MFKVAILIINDLCFREEKEDKCGRILEEKLDPSRFQIIGHEVIPVKDEIIREKIFHFSDELQVDLLLTAGGTGYGPKDITPEVTKEVVDREIPGIPEAMRAPYLATNPKVMLSRSAAGIRKKTLIINLPGSSQGTLESIEAIQSVIPRALTMITKKEA